MYTYITSHHITSHHITLHYTTLHYIHTYIYIYYEMVTHKHANVLSFSGIFFLAEFGQF